MKTFPLEARKAFLSLPQESSHIATNAPRWAEVFTPIDHHGALDPSRTVVVGDRGTGKSFWSSVLINRDIRNLVAKQYPRLRLDKVEGQLAFSDGGMAAQHPASTEIATIIGKGYSAEDIWRGVLLSFSPYPPTNIPSSREGWEPVVNWVVADPARRNSEFRALDVALTKAGKNLCSGVRRT